MYVGKEALSERGCVLGKMLCQREGGCWGRGCVREKQLLIVSLNTPLSVRERVYVGKEAVSERGCMLGKRLCQRESGCFYIT